MTRIAIAIAFLLAAGCAARGSEMRYQVERGSDLERELGYTLSVQDKHDEWRSDGGDGVFLIEGPAPEYVVKFHATALGKLKDLFELYLALSDANGTLVQAPLAIRSRWNRESEVDVRFLIKKDLIKEAVLTIRCGGSPNGEADYAIRLVDVPVLTLPKKSPPKKSLTEAMTIAEQFLRAQKIDVSNGVLLWAEFRNYLRNEREAPRWDIRWLVGNEQVDVWVSQDASAKLIRGGSPPRTLPQKSFTEAAAIAEDFLRAQKIDVSKHVLLRAEFKINFINGRETPFWDIAWGLGDERVIVEVWQDGSAKLIRAR